MVELESAPPPHLSPDAPPGIVDARPRFRRVFCEALDARRPGDAGSADCSTWLHRLDDELIVPATRPAKPTVPVEVLLVTGAFSECFGEHARPFDSAAAELADTGHEFHTIVVGGRSGTEHNATQIAAWFDDHSPEPGRPRILVGYSKGTSDILQFLADYPEQAGTVDAVVSVAGSVYGSPLADLFDGSYRLLFSHLPMYRCSKGDNDVIHSLRTDVRRQWLNETELPARPPYYSLAAFTTRDRLARSLVPTWKMLLKHDRRNDGQLLSRDALLPNSTLLGYLNADHWAVAMEIEQELEFFAHRSYPNQFPHAALLEAILDIVASDLSTPATARSRPISE